MFRRLAATLLCLGWKKNRFRAPSVGFCCIRTHSDGFGWVRTTSIFSSTGSGRLSLRSIASRRFRSVWTHVIWVLLRFIRSGRGRAASPGSWGQFVRCLPVVNSDNAIGLWNLKRTSRHTVEEGGRIICFWQLGYLSYPRCSGPAKESGCCSSPATPFVLHERFGSSRCLRYGRTSGQIRTFRLGNSSWRGSGEL